MRDFWIPFPSLRSAGNDKEKHFSLSPSGGEGRGEGAGASLLLALTLFLASAVSATACTTTLARTDFEKRGGRLVQRVPTNWNDLPRNFYCDRVVCTGAVAFRGVVDEMGAVRGIAVVKNTWQVSPEWHADVLKQRLAATAYRPPKLHGKSLCVKGGWAFDLRMGEPKP